MELAKKHQIYFSFINFLYLFFIFCVFSFGRAFSILSPGKIAGVPVFITEVFVLIALPLIIFKKDMWKELPRLFFYAMGVYFILGAVYLAGGLLSKNLFAIRDMVLFVYMVFFVMTVIIVNKRSNIQRLLVIFILGNMMGLLIGRFLMFGVYPSETARLFISGAKTFNLGLYYGISTAFLIAFWDQLKRWPGKALTLMITAMNLYMIIMFGVRTAWVAVGALFIYLLFLLRKKAVNFFMYFIPAFLIVSAALFCADFMVVKDFSRLQRVIKRGESTGAFIKNSLEVVRVNMSGGQSYKPVEKKELAASQKKPAKKKELAASKNKSAEKKKQVVLQKNRDFKIGLANIVWRRKVWGQSIAFGMENPVFGRGFGIYPPYKMPGYQSPQGIGTGSKIVPVHNHLITIFYKMGFLGLGLFLFINGYAFFYGLKYLRKCQDEMIKSFLTGSLGAFVYWHTMALAFDVIDSPPTSIFLWILMGCIFAAVRIDQETKREEERAA